MDLQPNTQKLIYILLAVTLVILSALPIFTPVAEMLRYIASLITGGVLVSKPGDAPAPLVDIVTKVAASLNPPAPPQPSD